MCLKCFVCWGPLFFCSLLLHCIFSHSISLLWLWSVFIHPLHTPLSFPSIPSLFQLFPLQITRMANANYPYFKLLFFTFFCASAFLVKGHSLTSTIPFLSPLSFSQYTPHSTTLFFVSCVSSIVRSLMYKLSCINELLGYIFASKLKS